MNAWSGTLIAGFVVLASGVLTACTGAGFALVNFPARFGEHERTADLVYGPRSRQKLDVYRPREPGAHPIVVFWYGGGWTSGSKNNYRFVGAALADAGYVAVLPDYRLYPEVRFPTFVEDGAAAVAWVLAHADEIGGDRQQIYLAGHSAGAHTAALLALDRNYLEAVGVPDGSIRGLIALSGPHALEPTSGKLARIFTDPYGPRDWQPVQSVDAEAPRTLLIHGREDETVWPRHSEQLATALGAAAVPVNLELVDERAHADIVAAFSSLLSWRAPTLDSVRQFIDSATQPH